MTRIVRTLSCVTIGGTAVFTINFKTLGQETSKLVGKHTLDSKS